MDPDALLEHMKRVLDETKSQRSVSDTEERLINVLQQVVRLFTDNLGVLGSGFNTGDIIPHLKRLRSRLNYAGGVDEDDLTSEMYEALDNLVTWLEHGGFWPKSACVLEADSEEQMANKVINWLSRQEGTLRVYWVREGDQPESLLNSAIDNFRAKYREDLDRNTAYIFGKIFDGSLDTSEKLREEISNLASRYCSTTRTAQGVMLVSANSENGLDEGTVTDFRVDVPWSALATCAMETDFRVALDNSALRLEQHCSGDDPLERWLEDVSHHPESDIMRRFSVTHEHDGITVTGWGCSIEEACVSWRENYESKKSKVEPAPAPIPQDITPRVDHVDRALRGLAIIRGVDADVARDELIVELLANLRLYCDKHELDFATQDKQAYQEYANLKK